MRKYLPELPELVDKLSSNSSRIVEVIKEVERPWRHCDWYRPYQVWSGGFSGSSGFSTTNAMGGTSEIGDTLTVELKNFSDIKTF